MHDSEAKAMTKPVVDEFDDLTRRLRGQTAEALHLAKRLNHLIFGESTPNGDEEGPDVTPSGFILSQKYRLGIASDSLGEALGILHGLVSRFGLVDELEAEEPEPTPYRLDGGNFDAQ